MHKSPAAMLNRPLATDVDTSIHQPRDPNTLANYNAWRMKHVTADLELDFAVKKLSGFVKINMARVEKGDSKVVLDTRCVYSLSFDVPRLSLVCARNI